PNDPSSGSTSSGDGSTAARPCTFGPTDGPLPFGPPLDVDLSVVAPAHNEEENVEALVEEVGSVLGGRPSLRFEMIVVDDGSTDRTLQRLKSARERFPWLRIVRMEHTPPGRGLGQSAAFKAGFAAARGRLIAVMDADRQNDPADLPEMLRVMELEHADMVQGDRSRNRRDWFGRRAASWVGRTFRRILLGDTIRDTGCSLRVMKRELALAIPLEFRGMHRFIPITARHMGYHVVEVAVNHRPRTAGEAKYGVFDRAIPGLIDCLAVRWMRNRRRPVSAVEETSDRGTIEVLPEIPSEVLGSASALSPAPAPTAAGAGAGAGAGADATASGGQGRGSRDGWADINEDRAREATVM
ncbi:MAG: glycosyltransferase family 2 protein, partial [Planctomycetota bacterium]